MRTIDLIRRMVAVGLALGLGSAAAESEERRIAAFNTYEYEPFLARNGSGGLVPELVRLLNRHLAGRLRLELQTVPRQRLVKVHLEAPSGFAGLGLLLSPSFVDDAQRQRYLWTDVLFEDRNVLVLPREQGGRRPELGWFRGKTMLTVRGQHYRAFDPLLADGSLRREEVPDERAALRQLMLGQADFTAMNELMYHHLAVEMNLQDRLQATAEPGSPVYRRRILVGRAAAEVLPWLNQAIAALHCDPAWRRLASQHGVAAQACGSAAPADHSPR